MAEQADRDAELLQDYYPDGEVAAGFTYRLDIIDYPVPRILFEIGSHAGIVLMRIWWERDQFGQFAEMVRQVAADAGCLPAEVIDSDDVED